MTMTAKKTKGPEQLAYEAKVYPCPGEAHSPEAAGNIDHCAICAPEWNRVPAHKALTPKARWLLQALSAAGGRLPASGAPMGAAEELVQEFRLARFAERRIEERQGRLLISERFVGVIELTEDGRQAAAAIERGAAR